jgi:lipoprotein-anchoring transpeptidase ErfK/SrfK
MQTNKDQQPAGSLNQASFIRRYLPDEKPILALVISVVLCAGIFFGLNYKPKPAGAHKSVQVAGITITNQDKRGASKKISQVAAAQKINIIIGDKTYTYAAKDLGVKRDVSSLLDTAFAPPNPLIDKVTADKTSAGLKTYVQKKRLVSTVESNLGQYKDPENASVSVSGGNLTVNPSKPGISLDFDQIIEQLKLSNLHGDLTVTASLTKKEPAIPTGAAEAAKSEAEAILARDYGVSSDSKSKFTSRAQKAGWLVFTQYTDDHIIGVSINTQSAKNTLTQLAKSFAQPVKDKVTLTATDGSATVIDEGQAGISLDQASLNDGLSQLQAAFTTGKAFTLPIKIAAQQPGERNLGSATGGKFVLVDIASFKAYAINNTTVDRTMLVSTGRPNMPTQRGAFKILRKTKLVTMSGCNTAVGCWTVPNVPNAEFFTSDGEALHGTYWYVNWGHQNASHGCVNLQLADAAWLYDWTSVGTDVIVV